MLFLTVPLAVAVTVYSLACLVAGDRYLLRTRVLVGRAGALFIAIPTLLGALIGGVAFVQALHGYAAEPVLTSGAAGLIASLPGIPALTLWYRSQT